MIYFGTLGHESKDLISYFQAIPGVPAITAGDLLITRFPCRTFLFCTCIQSIWHVGIHESDCWAAVLC